MTTLQNKTVALFASKLGYQTRNFEAAAQKRLPAVRSIGDQTALDAADSLAGQGCDSREPRHHGLPLGRNRSRRQ